MNLIQTRTCVRLSRETKTRSVNSPSATTACLTKRSSECFKSAASTFYVTHDYLACFFLTHLSQFEHNFFLFDCVVNA